MRTCQITNHMALVQGQHVSVYVWCNEMGTLFIDQLCFTRNCKQTSSRNILFFSDMWLDFAKLL